MSRKSRRKVIPHPFESEEAIPEAELDAVVEVSEPPLPWLTVEFLLYAVILVVAVALRLWRLGAYPLSNAEAIHSLVGLNLFQDALPEASRYSPLLVSSNAFTFLLFGDSDASARLVSVLLGSGLVLLPLTLRHRLGAMVCLLASALLALSAVAIFFSRTLNSEIAIATGALMVFVGFLNWTDWGVRFWLLLAATGLALMLVAGPVAYSILLVFTLLVVIRLADFKALWARGLALSSPELGLDEAQDDLAVDESPDDAAPQVEPTRPDNTAITENTGFALNDDLRQAGIVFLVTLILLATALTFNLSGFGVVATFLFDWLSLFGFQTQPEAGFNAVFLLTIYEPLLVFAGFSGIAYAILRQDFTQLLLMIWFVALLLLDIVMGGRPNGNVILPLVPLTFLAASALAELWHGVRKWGAWGNEGTLLAVGLAIIGFAYIGLTGWLTRSCSPDDRICNMSWLQAVAAFGLFCAVTIFFGLVSDSRSALRGAALTGVALGVLAMFSIGWRLNYGPLMDLAYQPLAGIPASTELVQLAETLADESEVRVNDETLIDTTLIGPASPALRWRLRAFRHLAPVDSIFESPLTTAIITPPETGDELGAGEPYIGQDFALDAVWSPVGLTPKQLIYWLIYRHSDERPQGNKAILWLRLEER